MSFLAACGDDDSQCGDDEVYSSAEDTCFTLCTDGSNCAADEICKTANPGSDDDRKICKNDPARVDCGPDEVASSDGNTCYTTCTDGSECASDETCRVANPNSDDDQKICKSANSNNNGSNNGSNNGELDCSETEMEVNLAGTDGPACYTTCTDDPSVCSGAAECTQLQDGTAICFETPTGSASCGDIFDCQGKCAQDDRDCVQSCVYGATSDGQDDYIAINQCFVANSCNSQNAEPSCLEDNCGSQLDTCFACPNGSDRLNFECITKCTADGDCDGGKKCVDPLLEDVNYKVCSFPQPDKLGDTCTEQGQCGGPDPSEAVGQSGGLCTLPQDAVAGDKASCLAVGCDASTQYGNGSGCGYQALCQSVPPQNPGDEPFTYCTALCDEQADCAGDGASCRIVSNTEEDGKLGICGNSCSPGATGDEDCSSRFQDEDGTSIPSRCNAQHYCELPCEEPASAGAETACVQGGGTCDSDGFCVYEEPATP